MDALKIEVGINHHAVEDIKVSFGSIKERIEFSDIIDGGRSFGEALTQFSKKPDDIVYDIQHEEGPTSRWTLVATKDAKVSLQLWHITESDSEYPKTEDSHDQFDLEIMVPFLSVVDAYKFFLKEFIAEFDQRNSVKKISKDAAMAELVKIEKLS